MPGRHLIPEPFKLPLRPSSKPSCPPTPPPTEPRLLDWLTRRWMRRSLFGGFCTCTHWPQQVGGFFFSPSSERNQPRCQSNYSEPCSVLLIVKDLLPPPPLRQRNSRAASGQTQHYTRPLGPSLLFLLSFLCAVVKSISQFQWTSACFTPGSLLEGFFGGTFFSSLVGFLCMVAIDRNSCSAAMKLRPDWLKNMLNLSSFCPHQHAVSGRTVTAADHVQHFLKHNI